jgi:hypothetical protein
MIVRRLGSSQTIRSGRCARSGRTGRDCHSVARASRELNASTSSSKEALGVQPGPWNSPSISTYGTAGIEAICTASVLLPAPDVPATSTRFGTTGDGSRTVNLGTTPLLEGGLTWKCVAAGTGACTRRPVRTVRRRDKAGRRATTIATTARGPCTAISCFGAGDP